MDRAGILATIIEYLCEFGELDRATVSEDTKLIGADAAIKSRALVELLLALEDFAETDLGCNFDWTSDQALSEANSAFRSVGSLTERLHQLAQGS